MRDWIAALDAATGEVLWRKFTIPAPGEPGSETWKGANNAWQTRGAVLSCRPGEGSSAAGLSGRTRHHAGTDIAADAGPNRLARGAVSIGKPSPSPNSATFCGAIEPMAGPCMVVHIP